MRILHAAVRIALPALIVSVMLACSAGAADQGQYLYQWTDDKGTMHITDSPEKVPAEYRSRTQSQRQSGAAGDAGQDQQVQQTPPRGAASAQDAAEAEADQKEAWQKRIVSAKGRLSDAEGRIRELEQRKQTIMSQWGSSGSTLPPQEVLDQIKRIDSDLDRTRKEVDSIRNEINVEIPDEARKAGIPPGWLREVQ